MTKRRLVISIAPLFLILLGLAVVAIGPAEALEKAERVCASSKLKATGQKVLGKLKCEAKAISKDVTVDSECLTKAETKFADKFAKADLKGGCISNGDAAMVEENVDALVEAMVPLQKTGSPLPTCAQLGAYGCGTCGDGWCMMYGTRLACVSEGSINDGVGCTSDAQCTAGEYCVTTPDGTNTACGAPCGGVEPPGPLGKAERACASSKLKATGKKVLGKLKCHAKAINNDVTVDPACLTKAETKFADKFAKTELKGGCVSEGDTAQVEAAVDGFVDEMVALEIIPPPILPSCTEVGGLCGTCEAGDGMCLQHDPDPGCVSFGSASEGTLCVSDADCPAGKYCMLAMEGFPPLVPDIWGCMVPCP